MGAWGVGTFDNDTACDWASELEPQSDHRFLAATLSKVLEVEDEYLDSDVACEGLAAAEVIARLGGRWGTRDTYTEAVDRWVQNHPAEPPLQLRKQAVAVIERILAEPSELLELWSESDEFETWKSTLADLQERLSA